MLSGIKFIPRDQLHSKNSDSDFSGEARDDSKSREKKKKNPRRGGDSSDRRRRKKKTKKRYSSSSDTSASESSSDHDEHRRSKRKKMRREGSSEHSDSPDTDEGRNKRKKIGKKNSKGKSNHEFMSDDDDVGEERTLEKESTVLRKEMGLEWMLSSGRTGITSQQAEDGLDPQVEAVKPIKEVNRVTPNELNPYLKDDGSGYPDDVSFSEVGNQLLSSSVVGDGGVSWRLKALKRAKEQAAREGRKLDDVVEERWGSLGQLAVSVSTQRAAPAHAHLHAIKDRKRGQIDKSEMSTAGEVKGEAKEVNRASRDYLRDVSSRHLEMRKPKRDYLSWKKNKGQNISSENSSLISSAISEINKFVDDGSFMDNISHLQSSQSRDAAASNSSPHASIETSIQKENKLDTCNNRKSSDLCTDGKHILSANKLSAKILKLRMKGKHEEAENLSKELEAAIEKQVDTTTTKRQTEESTSRYIAKQISSEQKKKEENADLYLAQKIIKNKQYGTADDEYEDDVAPSTKHNRRRKGIPQEKLSIPKGVYAREELCRFCFENQARPKHLVVSIADLTYMMLPLMQPVVEGHCCIITMQHDSATRTVENNVWQEIRNFKKCLLRMFARRDKNLLFLETVIHLSKQGRHCLIECIPIPNDLSQEAPMYFKKAIDEAEGEWGQHEMKKVIPTSGNLRNVIPPNMSYFHVEFGLDRGFVHVIDDDSNFPISFGLNVVRGMLRLPEEDMHRRRRHEPLEKQRRAVADFARAWEPFDWTKDLD